MNLVGQNTQELENTLSALGEQPFRGRQLAQWIYQKGATSFDEMTNIGAPLREKLKANCSLDFPEIVTRTTSSDKTTKLLLKMNDGESIESVRLPFADRLSVCVSSQAGCAMACQFCATGMGGFRRNLSTAEIIGQILQVKREGQLDSDSGDKWGQTPTHVVFMGMGEPLLNLQNVLKTIGLMHDEMGIPMRNITVSTVGIINGIEKLASHKLQLTLAISLHAPTDELRHRLIPTSTKTHVADIIKVAREYVKQTGRRVTFEYVVLGGVNDTPSMARELAALCKGWPCHVNLIPWNDVPGANLDGSGFGAPKAESLKQFKAILEKNGVTTTQRQQRGADVAAACGQLRVESQGKGKFASAGNVIPLSAIDQLL